MRCSTDNSRDRFRLKETNQTTEIMSMLKEDYIKRMTPLLSPIHYQMYFQGILKISTSRRTLWDSSQRHSQDSENI